MTGYVETAGGGRQVLPPLLQWSVKHTDGDPCDSFSLKCCLEEGVPELLKTAKSFQAVQGGRRVFTGVVDDYELSIDERGKLVEVTGRGLAAVLLDNQVPAAEYQWAQIQDILNTYVRPYGIREMDLGPFAPVRQFVVETGYTCWQVLAGFCRHSAEVYPRFTPEGKLVLRQKTAGQTRHIHQAECIQIRKMESRYGRLSRQVLINTRNGSIQEAADGEFQAAGGQRESYKGMTGDKIRALWRNARQRLEDAKRDKLLVEVTVPGVFAAWPLDRVELDCDALDLTGSYLVQCAESMSDETGERCVLTLREE